VRQSGKRKRQEFFLSIGAAIATAALVILVGRWQMNAAIEHQNARNQIISDEIAVLDKQIQEILGLEKQKERLLARMEIIETLQRSRPRSSTSSTRWCACCRKACTSPTSSRPAPASRSAASRSRAPASRRSCATSTARSGSRTLRCRSCSALVPAVPSSRCSRTSAPGTA